MGFDADNFINDIEFNEFMLIRKFRDEDAIRVSNIIKDGFQISNAPYYSKNSIQEQVEANSAENLIEKAKKVNYFVAVKQDKIVGFGGYDNKKVHTLFVDPEEQRQGIGKKILERILSEAKKEGIISLDSWSTYYAEKFYNNHGFKKIKNFVLQCKKSSIEFILMRKEI